MDSSRDVMRGSSITLTSPVTSENHIRMVQQAQTRQRPKTVGGMADSSVTKSFGQPVPYYVVLDERFKTAKTNVPTRQRMPTYPAYEAPSMRCEDLGLLVESKPSSTRQPSPSKFTNRPHPSNQKQKQKDEGLKSFQPPPSPARKKATAGYNASATTVVQKNRRQVLPNTKAYMPGDTNKHDIKIPSLARPKFTPKQEQWIQEHVQATRSHSMQPKAVYRPVQHHLYKTIVSISDKAAEDSTGQWRLEMDIMRHHSVKVDPSPARQQQRRQHQQEQLQRSASFVSPKKPRPEMAFHSPPSPSRSSPRINTYDSKHILNPLALNVDTAYERSNERSKSPPHAHNQHPSRPQTVPTQPRTSREASEAPPPRLYHPRSPNNAYEKSVGYSNVAADPVAFHRIRYNAPVESIREPPLVVSTRISRRVLTPQGHRARAQAAQINPAASQLPASLSPNLSTLVRGHTPTAPQITISPLGSVSRRGVGGLQTLPARHSMPSMTSCANASSLGAGGVVTSSHTCPELTQSPSVVLTGVTTGSNFDISPHHKDATMASTEKESSQLSVPLRPLSDLNGSQSGEKLGPAYMTKTLDSRAGGLPGDLEVPIAEAKHMPAISSETHTRNGACKDKMPLEKNPNSTNRTDLTTYAGAMARNHDEVDAAVGNTSLETETAQSFSQLGVTTVIDAPASGPPVSVVEVQGEGQTIHVEGAPNHRPQVYAEEIMVCEINMAHAGANNDKEGGSGTENIATGSENDDSNTGYVDEVYPKAGGEAQMDKYSHERAKGEGVEWKVDPLYP